MSITPGGNIINSSGIISFEKKYKIKYAILVLLRKHKIMSSYFSNNFSVIYPFSLPFPFFALPSPQLKSPLHSVHSLKKLSTVLLM